MINVGSARLPQVKLAKGRRGEVRKVPQARTGRRAHPPKPEKVLVEKINKKERRKAIRSAIAATRDIGLVKERGHRVGDIKKLPIIVDNAIESLKKTKEVREALLRLKLGEDLKRGEQKKIRAGRGTTRGRKYKKKKSVLIVVGSDKGVVKASKGIAGVDVSLAKNINADLLAPGGKPGRLTVYTESALSEIGKLFG
jgi:large subunit ribosomal protein L4e